MTTKEFHRLVIQTRGIQENNHFFTSLFEHRVGINDEDFLVVLEAVEKEEGNKFFEETLLRVLKLYNAGDIYSCYFTSYRYSDGKIVGGGRGRCVQYSHAIGFVPVKYSLTAEQVNSFPAWFDHYFPKLFASSRNDVYKAMLRTYDTSYLLGIGESEYIMLFSILEMIFGTGNTEITYQISRGTALLLSDTSDEMESIYKQMKKLYTARSKYVHNGTHIPIDCLYQLREIVRKILVKLVDLDYHTQEKSVDELRTKILLGGYHSFTSIHREE